MAKFIGAGIYAGIYYQVVKKDDGKLSIELIEEDKEFFKAMEANLNLLEDIGDQDPAAVMADLFASIPKNGKGIMICPKGHGQGEMEAKFCAICGAKLVPPSKKNLKPSYEIFGMQLCPGCGYGLDHNHQQYCPGCGHPLKWTCRDVLGEKSFD